MRKHKGFNHSYFVVSPCSVELQRTINKYRGKESNLAIYKRLKVIDRNVPGYHSFLNYINGVKDEVNQRKERVMEMVAKEADKELSDLDFLGLALRKAVNLGNTVLEASVKEVEEKVKKGVKLDWKEKNFIMSWFSNAGKLMMEEHLLKLKTADTITNMQAMQMLVDNCRYQNLDAADMEMAEDELENNINKDLFNAPSALVKLP